MPVSDETFIKVLGGFFMTVLTLFTGWINVKINRVEDKKLSKDVFREFKEANAHEHRAQNETLEKIWDKLDDKQDK